MLCIGSSQYQWPSHVSWLLSKCSPLNCSFSLYKIIIIIIIYLGNCYFRTKDYYSTTWKTLQFHTETRNSIFWQNKDWRVDQSFVSRHHFGWEGCDRQCVWWIKGSCTVSCWDLHDGNNNPLLKTHWFVKKIQCLCVTILKSGCLNIRK